MRLIDLETRGDWPTIATAIPCPVCGAEIGNFCWNKMFTVPSGNGQPTTPPSGSRTIRTDFHAERKAAAVQNWEQRDAGKV